MVHPFAKQVWELSRPAIASAMSEPVAVVCESPPTPEEEQEATQDASTKLSKRGKGQSEFVSVLESKIHELEKGLSSSSQIEREAAKARRKQLRELQRYVADTKNSPEDKTALVQAKYVQQASEFMKMEKHYLEVQKELDLVTRERDKVQVELRKSNTLRDRLEELCRQLQRENREVLEESKRRNEEEMKQRQALQLKFTQAINDVTSKMDEQQQDRTRQLTENDGLRTKLGEVLQQFDTFTQLLQSKDLEVQLANAKLEQQLHLSAQVTHKAELLQAANENLNKANEIMKRELEHHFAVKEQNALLNQNNRELKGQIEAYCDKFSEFQTTLTKSNEMFTTLKKEIESTNKHRGQLIREREEFRKRTEKAESNMLVLLEESRGYKKQIERVNHVLVAPRAAGEQQGVQAEASSIDAAEEVRKLRTQKERLEGLCRVLQTQLKGLQQQGAASESEGIDVITTSAAAEDAGSGEQDAVETGN